MNQPPNFLNEESVLSIEKLVAWKKNRNSYNFTSLPKTVILHGNLNRNPLLFKYKKLKGLKGIHTISKDKRFLISTNLGDGAPELIGICEELRCLGVEHFIFIGTGGMISDKVNEGECYHITKAFSGVGISQYYGNTNEFVIDTSDWTDSYLAKVSSKPATCFSTDAPFRETKSLLDHYRKLDTDIVDMECAGLVAFSEFHSVSVLCFLFGADRINQEWNPPTDYPSIIQHQRKLINQLKA